MKYIYRLLWVVLLGTTALHAQYDIVPFQKPTETESSVQFAVPPPVPRVPCDCTSDFYVQVNSTPDYTLNQLNFWIDNYNYNVEQFLKEKRNAIKQVMERIVGKSGLNYTQARHEYYKNLYARPD